MEKKTKDVSKNKLQTSDALNILRMTYKSVKGYGTLKRFCVVSEDTGKSGLVDEHGNVIIKCIYDEIKPFTKQLLLCTLTKKNKAFDYGKLQMFDMDGNLIIDDLNGDDVMFKPSRFEKIGTAGYLFNGILKSDSNFVRVIRNGAEADTKSKLFVSRNVGVVIGIPNFMSSEYSKTCPNILTIVCVGERENGHETKFVKAIRLDQPYLGIIDLKDCYDKIEELSLEDALELGRIRGYDNRVLQVMGELNDMKYYLGHIKDETLILNNMYKPVHFHRVNRVLM